MMSSQIQVRVPHSRDQPAIAANRRTAMRQRIPRVRKRKDDPRRLSALRRPAVKPLRAVKSVTARSSGKKAEIHAASPLRRWRRFRIRATAPFVASLLPSSVGTAMALEATGPISNASSATRTHDAN